MKKIRKKRCVICHESFTPQYTSLQKACSPKCASDFGILKEAKKKADLNKVKNEKFTTESLSKLMHSTKILVHSYIRERDKGKSCISCGAEWQTRFQAGHRYDVKQHNGIRFDLENIHGQCEQCNTYKEGNYAEYHLRLPNRIGIESYQKLEKRAKIALRIPHTYTRHELKEIQKAVKQLKDKLCI